MWERAISSDEVDSYIEKFEKLESIDATIFAGAAVDTEIRSSKVRWVHDQGVRDVLSSYVTRANVNAFGVDVYNYCEVQYTEYYATENGHYGWHHDVHWQSLANSDRKLSVTVQLSDPSEYEGGDFEFAECDNPTSKEKGTIVVFPSYLSHRVTPVTKGVRKSLVAWFHGPRWR
jgi:PKHD-type hydroxylase